MGVGPSGADGGQLVSEAREAAAMAGEEPLGARPREGATWVAYDAAAPPRNFQDATTRMRAPLTVWMRTVLGGLRSRATALVVPQCTEA